jgi:hypothetical protein
MKEIGIMAQNMLVGTWKLESVQYEFADTGEFADMYGAKTHTGHRAAFGLWFQINGSRSFEECDNALEYRTET